MPAALEHVEELVLGTRNPSNPTEIWAQIGPNLCLEDSRPASPTEPPRTCRTAYLKQDFSTMLDADVKARLR